MRRMGGRGEGGGGWRGSRRPRTGADAECDLVGASAMHEGCARHQPRPSPLPPKLDPNQTRLDRVTYTLHRDGQPNIPTHGRRQRHRHTRHGIPGAPCPIFEQQQQHLHRRTTFPWERYYLSSSSSSSSGRFCANRRYRHASALERIFLKSASVFRRKISKPKSWTKYRKPSA